MTVVILRRSASLHHATTVMGTMESGSPAGNFAWAGFGWTGRMRDLPEPKSGASLPSGQIGRLKLTLHFNGNAIVHEGFLVCTCISVLWHFWLQATMPVKVGLQRDLFCFGRDVKTQSWGWHAKIFGTHLHHFIPIPFPVFIPTTIVPVLAHPHKHRPHPHYIVPIPVLAWLSVFCYNFCLPCRPIHFFCFCIYFAFSMLYAVFVM